MSVTFKQPPTNNPTWTSDRRIYLDKDGGVVENDDPKKLTLLVAEGGTLPMEKAVGYGLVKAEEEKPAATAPIAEAQTASDEPKAEETSDEADDGLESLTVAELRELAKEEGVSLTGITAKADIIAAIAEKREGGD